MTISLLKASYIVVPSACSKLLEHTRNLKLAKNRVKIVLLYYECSDTTQGSLRILRNAYSYLRSILRDY